MGRPTAKDCILALQVGPNLSLSSSPYNVSTLQPCKHCFPCISRSHCRLIA